MSINFPHPNPARLKPYTAQNDGVPSAAQPVTAMGSAVPRDHANVSAPSGAETLTRIV